MKKPMKTKLLLMALGTILITAPCNLYRVVAQQPDEGETARGRAEDPIQDLRLTAEQRQQIRAIRRQMREERMTVNRLLLQANRDLEEVLDSDNPDEAVIEQRLRELSVAQTAQVRMRVLAELKIRRVLTEEQRAVWRELRQARRRNRPLENLRRRRELPDRRLVQPSRGNNQAPGTPRAVERRRRP